MSIIYNRKTNIECIKVKKAVKFISRNMVKYDYNNQNSLNNFSNNCNIIKRNALYGLPILRMVLWLTNFADCVKFNLCEYLRTKRWNEDLIKLEIFSTASSWWIKQKTVFFFPRYLENANETEKYCSCLLWTLLGHQKKKMNRFSSFSLGKTGLQ